MKATQLCCVVAAIALCMSAQAQTYYRVNRDLTGANIFTLDAAITAAAAAYLIDPAEEAVLIVEGSALKYDLASPYTIDFPVTMYGTGFFLDENPETQANPNPSHIEDLIFAPGSEGSKVGGLSIDNLTVDANTVSATKNYIQSSLIVSADNVTISKSFIEGSNAGELVRIVGASNLIFMNNLVHNTDPAGLGNLVMSGGSNGVILYNSFWGDPDNILLNATVQGNWFSGSEFDLTTTSSNLTVSDNAMDEAMTFLNTAAGGNDPLYIAIPDSVFCLYAAPAESSDGQYGTNIGFDGSTNPIYDYGGNETTHGMYGGIDPYLLSGMPRIPSIYSYVGNASGTSGSGTSSQVGTKTHK